MSKTDLRFWDKYQRSHASSLSSGPIFSAHFQLKCGLTLSSELFQSWCHLCRYKSFPLFPWTWVPPLILYRLCSFFILQARNLIEEARVRAANVATTAAPNNSSLPVWRVLLSCLLLQCKDNPGKFTSQLFKVSLWKLSLKRLQYYRHGNTETANKGITALVDWKFWIMACLTEKKKVNVHISHWSMDYF